MQKSEILIIGGGVMGCAAAYHLARAGHAVTVIERFDSGHKHGSSHGVSRVIRLNYTGDDYVQLARIAYAQWHALEQAAGIKLLLTTGGLDMGEPAALASMRDTLTRQNVAFDYIDEDEIRRRSPMLRPPEGTMALYQNDYGVLYANKCLEQMTRLAIAAGAKFQYGETVHHITPAPDSVQIATDRAHYSADRLILSAGPWMRGLLLKLGLDIPLTVIKETNLYYKPEDPRPYEPGRFPLFLQRFKGNTVIGNAFPLVGHAGVKVILDRHGPQIDPDTDDLAPDLPQAEKIRAYRRKVLPLLGENVIETATCRYTMTPDEDFVIDTHPQFKHIVIGSPCSGHGFKFGITLGQMLGDFAVHGTSDLPGVPRFRLDRPGLAPGTAWSR